MRLFMVSRQRPVCWSAAGTKPMLFEVRIMGERCDLAGVRWICLHGQQERCWNGKVRRNPGTYRLKLLGGCYRRASPLSWGALLITRRVHLLFSRQESVHFQRRGFFLFYPRRHSHSCCRSLVGPALLFSLPSHISHHHNALLEADSDFGPSFTDSRLDQTAARNSITQGLLLSWII